MEVAEAPPDSLDALAAQHGATVAPSTAAPTYDKSTWDARPDGSAKGQGFLGVLARPDGGVASEYSVSTDRVKDSSGKEVDFPTLVPTLTKAEIQTVLSLKDGQPPPRSIIQKAEDFALQRQKDGLPLFARSGEQRLDLYPDVTRAEASSPSGASASTAPGSDLDALAKTHGAIVPDFKAEAEKPSLWDLAKAATKGVVDQVNPVPLLQTMYDVTKEQFDQALTAAKQGDTAGVIGHNVQAAFAAPAAVAKGLVGGQLEQFEKAYAAYHAGHLSEALGHTLAATLPVIGPAAAKAGEEIATGDPTQMAHGVGGAAGLLLPAALAKVVPRDVSVPALAEHVTPAVADAVRFGMDHEIPVDAATATGNKAVAAVQHLADRTLGGSVVAGPAAQAQADAFSRVGDDLAARVHPDPATPETAGADVRTAIGSLIGDLHGQATDAYGRLRAIEANPENAERVPAKRPAPEQAQIDARMTTSLGYVPSPAELRELRRIQAEMEHLPYTARTWTEAAKKSGNAAGGDYNIVKGAAGAPVYDDIMQHAPGTSAMTRGEVTKAIDSALQTGHFTNAAKGALEVARLRLTGGQGLSAPMLPPSAGSGDTASMLMPVDMTDAKTTLKPLYDRLKRESELVPLMGDKGRALVALDRLITGPDHAPVSVVDGALGDLKAMARGAALPELRTEGQGAAAAAVKQLSAAVDDAVQKAGPEAVQALAEGRAATVAKHGAAALLEKVREEPVQAFRQAIYAKDAGIAQLRAVAEHAPAELPKIGRAYLEDLFQHARADGAFDKANGLAAKWNALGPETKKLLFPPDVIPDLDRFFLLAKKAAETPNPSGTGHVVSMAGQGALLVTNPLSSAAVQISGAALSKLLRSPAFVKAITRGFQVQAGASTYGAATAAEIVKLAGDHAVPVTAPAAAGDQSNSPATSVQR